MNAVTALLLSLLVHLGGVELDTTRDAALQWYERSQLSGQWELEAARSGAYRFVSDEDLVIVERLREAPLTYTVLYYEGVDRASGGGTAPIPRTLRSLGTVNLQPQAQNLRAPRSSRGEVTVNLPDIAVAWTERAASETDDSADDSVDDSDTEESSETTQSSTEERPGGTVTVTITPGQWTAHHTGTDQVIVLQVR
ncbi:MAG: hypothetical protein ACOCYB_11765 [Alkalispirochaeta sp.]